MATFGKRDLGLLLDHSVESNSLIHTEDNTAAQLPEKTLIPKIDPSKRVHRLRAKKEPAWYQEEDADDDLVGGKKKTLEEEAQQDRRLQRLRQLEDGDQEGRQPGRRRERYEAELVVQESDEEEDGDMEGYFHEVADEGKKLQEEEEEDEEEIAARRARAREKMKERKEEEAADFGPEEEEEEESEYETDTDESEVGGHAVLFKPVFIPKSKRDALVGLTSLTLEDQEEEELKKKELKKQERRRETKNLVAEVAQKEEQEEHFLDGNDSEDDRPNDADLASEEALEVEKWKVRELARIKRDREARLVMLKEQEMTERRRNMTDAERAADDRAAGKNKQKQKAKWKFMQKYYHKGVFYMDEDNLSDNDVRKREATEPTLEDKFNKEALPKVMQVKNFGRSGQTKYTHLLDQDTTSWDSPFVQSDPKAMQKVQRKMGGVGDLDLPKKKKTKLA